MGEKYIKDGKLYEKGGVWGDKELGTVEKGGIFSQDTVKMHDIFTPDMKIERTGLLGENVDIVSKDTLSEFIEGKREGTRIETENHVLYDTTSSYEWTQELGGAKIPKDSASSGNSYGDGGGGSSSVYSGGSGYSGSSSNTFSYGIGTFLFIIVCIGLGIGLISSLTKSSNTQNYYPTQQYTPAPYQAPAPAPSQINITKAVIAEGLDSNQIPVGTSNSFSAGYKTLYYYVSYTGAIPNETTFVYRWYKDGNEIQNSQFALIYASGNAWNPVTYNFEPGVYDVKLYGNNQELGRTVFNVETISADTQRAEEQQRQQEAERQQREAEYQRRQYEEQQLAAKQWRQREAEYQQRENAQRQWAENQWRQKQAEQQRREAEINQILQRNRWQAEQRRQRQIQQQRRVLPLYPIRNY